MSRWIRVVVPPVYVLAFAVVCALAYCGPQWISRLFVSGDPVVDAEDLRDAIALGTRFLTWVLCAGVFVYGIYRVFRFAPFSGRSYFHWLLSMPYDGRQPLPAGPLGVVVQDAVLVLLAEVIAVRTGALAPGRVLTIFLFAYLLALVLFFFSTSDFGLAYVVAFGLFLAVRLLGEPIWAAGAATATAVVAHVATGRVLRRFPWSETYLLLSRTRPAPDAAPEAPEVRLSASAADISLRWSDGEREEAMGWPLGILAARKSERMIGPRWGLLLGLLAGWATYCFIGYYRSVGTLKEDEEFLARLVVFYPVAFTAGMRLMAYGQRYRAPISFLGRLLTGRWIIPRYDRVWVAPLTGILAVLLLPSVLKDLGFAPFFAVSVSAGLSMAIILAGPPSLGEWRLTGKHRIAMGRKADKSGKYIQV